jgi:multidrug efflux pump subunit AcrA (membrane-fusion protein)
MSEELVQNAFAGIPRETIRASVQEKSRAMRTRRKWLWIGLALAVTALGSAGAWYTLTRSASPAGPAVAPVTRRDLSATVTATGTIKAMVGAEVRVGARIPGRVEELTVQVGDRVKAGQVIARLEQDDLRAAVEKARADLAAAEAKLATVRNGARAQEIQTAEAALRQAEANRLLAQVNLDRYRQLYQDGGIALQVVDTAARDYDVTVAQVRTAREQLSLTREKYTPEDLQYAVAEVAQTKAALRIAETNLGYATITAPMGGVVASVSTQQGETVTSGSAAAQAPTFVTIIDLNRLQVDAYVDETDIGKVHVSQDAVFAVDAFPDREFRGKVTAIYPKALIQQNVVDYDVVITIDNREGLLRPDMTTNTTITVAKREKVLVIPNQAVRREDGDRVVFVQEGDRLVRRPVKTGWKDKTYTEVLSGLKDGERVAVGDIENGKAPTKGTLPSGVK